MLQSAALRMSNVVTPALEAVVVAAPRTECALKMAGGVNTAFSNVLLSQRVIVELEATQWGLIVVRNRGLTPFPSCAPKSYPRMPGV